MSVYDVTLRLCGDCAAKPGELHMLGCDTEVCALCGYQAIACDSAYEANGIDPHDLEEKNPDLFNNGPTDEMWEVFSVEVEKVGGRIPWSGEAPMSRACREAGWFVYGNPGGDPYWQECGPDHPKAVCDLNKAATVLIWDREKRDWRNPRT